MASANIPAPKILSREFVYTIIYDGIRGEFQLLKIYDDGSVVRLGRFPSRISAQYALLTLPVGRVWP
jgi:hypothetical protein